MTKSEVLRSLAEAERWILRDIKKSMAVIETVENDDVFTLYDAKDEVSNMRIVLEVVLKRIKGLEDDVNGELFK